MMPIVREPKPECLVQNATKYTARYLAQLHKHKKQDNQQSKPQFAWPTFQKKRLNQILLSILASETKMTKNHCSYCDGFPLGALSRQTIDHFQPKETYPELAFEWTNLFLCCDRCQEVKQSNYTEALIKPDDSSYRFEDFFLFNYHTGEIEVNPFANDNKKQRAEATLSLLDLNDAKRQLLPSERLRVAEDKALNQDRHHDAWPYRFIQVE